MKACPFHAPVRDVLTPTEPATLETQRDAVIWHTYSTKVFNIRGFIIIIRHRKE